MWSAVLERPPGLLMCQGQHLPSGPKLATYCKEKKKVSRCQAPCSAMALGACHVGGRWRQARLQLELDNLIVLAAAAARGAQPAQLCLDVVLVELQHLRLAPQALSARACISVSGRSCATVSQRANMKSGAPGGACARRKHARACMGDSFHHPRGGEPRTRAVHRKRAPLLGLASTASVQAAPRRPISGAG